MKLFPCSLGGPHQFKLIDNMSVRALFLAFEEVRNINLSSAVSTQRAEKVKAPYTIIDTFVADDNQKLIVIFSEKIRLGISFESFVRQSVYLSLSLCKINKQKQNVVCCKCG